MKLALLSRGVRSAAIGHGIARAIYAATEPNPATVEDWLHFCTSAAEEAAAMARESPPTRAEDEGSAVRLYRELLGEGGIAPPPPEPLAGAELAAAIRETASAAFRACMPRITGRRATQAYIACVALGLQRGYLTGAEAKALLYTAQLALAAYPHRRANRGRKDSK